MPCSSIDVSLGLLHSLEYEHMLAREEQLTNAKSPTLEWVWSLPSGHASIAEWLSTKTGVFWIEGKPGSGKSTLLNYLKDHKQTKYLLSQANHQEWAILRFFFDFRARKGTSNSFDGLLRALLFQLVLEIPALSSSIAKFGKEDHLQPKNQRDLQWTHHKLRQALMTALKTSPINICIFIDGLDELEGVANSMLDVVEFLHEVESLDSSPHHIKLCIASRADPLMVAAFENSSGFKLQHYNDNGIKEYVNRRLEIAARDPDSTSMFVSHLKHFATNVTERAQGVFLWAVFATDEMLVGIAEGDELGELQARLEALPDELEATYSRIMDRTIRKCGGSQETSIMLQIAYFTIRSLSLEEFFAVFQLSKARNIPAAAYSPVAFEKRLRSKTGGLVEIVGGVAGKVKLIHETVRRYLDSLNSDFNGYGTTLPVPITLTPANINVSITQKWDLSTSQPQPVSGAPASLESINLIATQHPVLQWNNVLVLNTREGGRRRRLLPTELAEFVAEMTVNACIRCRISKVQVNYSSHVHKTSANRRYLVFSR